METCDIEKIKKDCFGCPWDLFYFSCDGGQRAPRPYIPEKDPQCIVRSHPDQDGQILIEHLRKTWPHVTYGIFPPRNFQTLWDAFDVGVLGATFLRAIVDQIGNENQQILGQFMVKWLSDQKDNYSVLRPDELDVDHAFHQEDHERFGRLFLEHALFWIQVRYREAQQIFFPKWDFEKSSIQRALPPTMLRASDPGPPVSERNAPMSAQSTSEFWTYPGHDHFTGTSYMGNPQYRLPPAQYGPALGVPGSSVPYPHMPIPYVTGSFAGPYCGNYMPWINSDPQSFQMQAIQDQTPQNFPPNPPENPHYFPEYSNEAHDVESGPLRRYSISHGRATHSRSRSQQSPSAPVEVPSAIYGSQNVSNRGSHNGNKRGGRRKSTIDRAFEYQRNLPAPPEHAELKPHDPHAVLDAYGPHPNNVAHRSFENFSHSAQMDRSTERCDATQKLQRLEYRHGSAVKLQSSFRTHP